MAASDDGAQVSGDQWEEQANEFLQDTPNINPRASMRIESFKGCTNNLVVALQQRAAHTQVAEAVHRMTVDELLSPVDELGRTILHAAALFNSQAVCIAALTAHHAEIDHALEETTTSLRMAAVERGCAVTPNRAHLVMQDLRTALARGDDVFGRKGTPSLASLNLRRRVHIVQSMDRLQRLALLAKERGAQVLLRAVDSWGRIPLHYAAAARGRTVPVLLNPPVTAWHAVSSGGTKRFTPSADLRAVGRGRYDTADPGSMWRVLGLCGGPLFPPRQPVDVATGQLAGQVLPRGEPRALPQALHRLVLPLGAQLAGAVLMTAASEGGLESSQGGAVPAPASVDTHLHSCAKSALSSDAWLHDLQSDDSEAFHTVTAADLRAMRRQLGNVHDLASCTPLHYAAARGDVSAVQSLLAAGADASVQNTDGGTPLDVAKTQVVRRALAPLTQAVSSAVAPAVAQFAQDGSNAVFDDFAASLSSAGVSQEGVPLAGPFSPIRGGASSTRRGGHELGSTFASLAQHRPLGGGSLRTLADFGLNINTPTGPALRTPLHLAAAAGDEDTARMLLARGAEVDMCDAAGCTALHIAARNACGGPRFRRLAQCLLEAGANVQATSSTRSTPLHCAAALARDLDCNGLAEDVAIASHLEYKEWRAQHIAGEAPLGSTVRPPPCGSSAGDHAGAMSAGRRVFYAEATRMLGVLASQGGLLDAVDNQGRTPLHVAAAADKPSAVDVLLRLGAFPYARDMHMNTPLHLAAQHGAWRCVRLMSQLDAEFGVLLTSRDSSGRYPFQVAKDARSRLALTSLWEAAAAGSLDLVAELLTKVLAEQAQHSEGGASAEEGVQGTPRSAPGSDGDERKEEEGGEGQRSAALPPAPWLPARAWSCTRVLRRTPLHCLMTGAAAALHAQRSARGVAARVQPRAGGVAPEVAAVLQATGGSTARPTRQSPWLAGRSPARVNKGGHLTMLQDIDHPDTVQAAPASANVIAGVGLSFAAAARGGLRLKDTPPQSTGRLLPASTEPSARHSSEAVRAQARPESLVIRQRHLVPAVAHVTAAYTTSHIQRSAAALASQASSGASSEDEGDSSANGATHASAMPVALNARARTVHPEDVRVEKRFMRVVQLLLAAGAAPNEPDVDGVTPVMLAARYGLTLLFATLLQGGEGGAALHARDSWGNSALHWACAFKQAHILLVAEQVAGRQLKGCVDDAGVWGNHREQSLRGVWGVGMRMAPKGAEARLSLRQAPTKSKRLGVSAPL